MSGSTREAWRRQVACQFVSRESMRISEKKLFSSGSVPKETFVYTFSSLISNGGLVGCLLLSPSYFTPDPSKRLNKLTVALRELERRLSNYIYFKHKTEIDKTAKNLFSSSSTHEQTVGFLLACCSFDLFSKALQFGLTIESRKFKFYSTIIPTLSFTSDEASSLITQVMAPLYKEFKWSLRMVSKIKFLGTS